MIKTETYKVEKEEERTIEASCDFCGYKFDKNIVSCNGFGQIGISFGFGSKFDDDYFGLQICDKCFIKEFGFILREQFREKDYNMKKLMLDYPSLEEDVRDKCKKDTMKEGCGKYETKGAYTFTCGESSKAGKLQLCKECKGEKQ